MTRRRGALAGTALGCAALALGVLLSSGCIDPGCIRNSECNVGFSCINAVCVFAADGGVSKPGPDDDDAGAR